MTLAIRPSIDNPYRAEFPGKGPFYGRHEHLTLVSALRTGRRAIAAIMGGRGIGKTTLALRIQQELASGRSIAAHYIRRPAPDATSFLAQLEVCLGRPLSINNPSDSLIAAVNASSFHRIALLIDEVEVLISSAESRRLLDNLRIAYEALDGRLGIVVFGGSELQLLLLSNTSPFLRTAHWTPLTGLLLREVGALMREPLGLDLPDETVEAWWSQTGGHPYLLTSILEHWSDNGAPAGDKLTEALAAQLPQFESRIFPIWWRNLGTKGQALYQGLVAASRPLNHTDRLHVLDEPPKPWDEILTATGVARLEDDHLSIHGSLFREWVVRNHPRVPTARPVKAAAKSVGTKSGTSKSAASKTLSIPTPPPALVTALQSNNAVAILGSGLSCAAGAASWERLLHGMIHEAEETQPYARKELATAIEAMRGGRYLDAAGLLKKHLGTELAGSVTRHLFSGARFTIVEKAVLAALANKKGSHLLAVQPATSRLQVRPTTTHRQIALLGFRAIVTTNYDLFIEDAWPAGSLPAVYSRSYEHLAARIQEGVRFVFKLHGDLKHPEDIVLAREDYSKVIFHSQGREALEALCTTSKPLWLGYGHNDPDLDLLLDKNRERLGVGGGFALCLEEDALTRKRLADARIHASLLASHADLPRFLRELAVRTNRSVAFSVDIDHPDADEAVARRLGEMFAEKLALVGIKVTVWRAAETHPVVIDLDAAAEEYMKLIHMIHARARPLFALFNVMRIRTVDGVSVS